MMGQVMTLHRVVGPGHSEGEGKLTLLQERGDSTKRSFPLLLIVYRTVLVLPEKMDTRTFSLKRQKPSAGRAKILQSMLEGKRASKEIKGSV